MTLGSRPSRNGSPCSGRVPGLGNGIPSSTTGSTIPPAASSQRAWSAESSSKVRYHRSTSGTERVFSQNWRIEAARAFRAAGSTVFHPRRVRVVELLGLEDADQGDERGLVDRMDEASRWSRRLRQDRPNA